MSKAHNTEKVWEKLSLLSRKLGRTELRKTESIRTRSSIVPKDNTLPVTITKNENVTSAHINFPRAGLT